MNTTTTWAVAALLLTSPLQAAQCPQLVWSDEFNGNSLDSNQWEIQAGDGCDIGLCGWGNNEQQWYQAQNATVANGLLTITAKKERVRGKSYTSARLRTANKPLSGQWTYGRFEARMKLPTGAGLWPAFWMLPTNPDQVWPISGEIDILEATGQADMIAFGTLHYGQPYPNNQWTSGRVLKQPDKWSDAFHVYAVEWTPDRMRWYIDGLLYSEKTPADLGDAGFWTFDKYQYHILLNLAVGGNLGGWVDSNVFPQSLQVDYVRVYNGGAGGIQGAHLVEANSQQTYRFTGDLTGATVNWSAPAGSTVASTGIPGEVQVQWGSQGGTLTATVVSACGSSQSHVAVHVQPTQSIKTMLDDGNAVSALNYTTVTGALSKPIANPAPNSVNSSAEVIRYQRNAAEQWDVITAKTSVLNDASLLLQGQQAFYLDLYTNAPVGTELLIQLENSQTATASNYPVGRHSKYLAKTTVQGQWQRLKFNLDDRMDGQTLASQVDQLVLLIAPNSADGSSYYLDNFALYDKATVAATSVHVQSISLGSASAGKAKKYATATVQLVSDQQQAVAGATVTGQFSGTIAEQVSGITDSNGMVLLQTLTSSGGTLTESFCVTSVSHPSLSYQASANVVSCKP